VICDLCNVATHQSCYGGPLEFGVPSGNWYCDRCLKLISDKTLKCTEIKCFLCPDIDGLMKCIDSQNSLWAHVICVNYNPDISFKTSEKNSIEGQLNKKRFQLKCGRCKSLRHSKDEDSGACIQCAKPDCSRSYHVRCAVKSGMIQEWDLIEKLIGQDLATVNRDIPFFCKKHQDSGYSQFKKSLSETPSAGTT
jgi:hypothetical protein